MQTVLCLDMGGGYHGANCLKRATVLGRQQVSSKVQECTTDGVIHKFGHLKAQILRKCFPGDINTCPWSLLWNGRQSLVSPVASSSGTACLRAVMYRCECGNVQMHVAVCKCVVVWCECGSVQMRLAKGRCPNASILQISSLLFLVKCSFNV